MRQKDAGHADDIGMLELTQQLEKDEEERNVQAYYPRNSYDPLQVAYARTYMSVHMQTLNSATDLQRFPCMPTTTALLLRSASEHTP